VRSGLDKLDHRALDTCPELVEGRPDKSHKERGTVKSTEHRDYSGTRLAWAKWALTQIKKALSLEGLSVRSGGLEHYHPKGMVVLLALPSVVRAAPANPLLNGLLHKRKKLFYMKSFMCARGDSNPRPTD
jgi:hypothetical protein